MTQEFTQERVEAVAKEIFNLPASANDQEDSIVIAQWYLYKTASLESENKRLREVLEDVEWSAVRRVGGYTVPACPCCYGGNPNFKKSLTSESPPMVGLYHVTDEYADEKLGHRKECKLQEALNPKV